MSTLVVQSEAKPEVCDGYAHDVYKIRWTPEATFVCSVCQQTHVICAVANGYFLCGLIDGHEGPHRSVTKRWEFDNSHDKPRDTTGTSGTSGTTG